MSTWKSLLSLLHNVRLEVKDQIFETESEALAFADLVENAGSIKIFNHTGELTHTIVDTPAPTESYA